MIYAIITLSLCLNVFFVWFIYKTMFRMGDLVLLIEDLQFKINLFAIHLNKIYELEVFYGEPTLQKLIEHSKDLLESFTDFNQQYDMFDENKEEENEQIQEKVQD